MAKCKAESLVYACGIAVICTMTAFCVNKFATRKKSERKYIRVRYVYSKNFEEES